MKRKVSGTGGEGRRRVSSKSRTTLRTTSSILRLDALVGEARKEQRVALLAGASVVVKAQTVEELTQRSGRTVRRVNCSQLRSKYIGETEKNLSALFDEAERNDWILFFDEADALFGKRTGVKDSHDRYANQEVAYLLKRMETFNGLTVFATNDEQDLPRKLLVRATLIEPSPNEEGEVGAESQGPH